ncbi:MAG: hypothetical protein ACJ8J0_01105 [Longimicrobiaceae bacterium]
MKRSLSAACVALLAGCSGISDLCTLVDCDSGLLVQLAQTPTGPYRIEVFSHPESPHYVFDCANPATCGYALFVDYTPSQVTIRVTTAAGTSEQTVKPTYDVDRPNGPNCDPACMQGTVTVPLPG